MIDFYKDGWFHGFKKDNESLASTKVYRNGKSMAKNVAVEEWFHPHGPVLLQKYHHPRVDVDFTAGGEPDKCDLPSTPFFLRHFKCLSYEDTVNIRAKNKYDSGNY